MSRRRLDNNKEERSRVATSYPICLQDMERTRRGTFIRSEISLRQIVLPTMDESDIRVELTRILCI